MLILLFVQMQVSHVVMKEKPVLKIILKIRKCTQSEAGRRLWVFDIKHPEAIRDLNLAMTVGQFVGFLTILAVANKSMNFFSLPLATAFPLHM